MSDQINVATVQQYKANVELLLQQKGSRLRGAVSTAPPYVGKAAKAVEQIGKVAAVKRTTRHADTPLISTPHDARWVFPEDYEWADLIDEQDKLRMIAEFQSPYAENGAHALGRGIDNEIIAAFFGESKTGENGKTATSFLAANTIAAGGDGLTVAKLRTAKKLLMAADVDIDNDPLFLSMTAIQHDNLLGETQAISLDYTNKPVLVEGRITSFMGFNFIHTELLGVDSASARRCPAWAKSGMHLGVWGDIQTEIGPRADKSYSVQVYVKETIGATRLEEGKVIEILCAE